MAEVGTPPGDALATGRRRLLRDDLYRVAAADLSIPKASPVDLDLARYPLGHQFVWLDEKDALACGQTRQFRRICGVQVDAQPNPRLRVYLQWPEGRLYRSHRVLPFHVVEEMSIVKIEQ